MIALLLSLPAVPSAGPSQRIQAVTTGQPRLLQIGLTSQFGVGAGPTLALDCASKLVTVGRTGAAHHRTITDNSG